MLIFNFSNSWFSFILHGFRRAPLKITSTVFNKRSKEKIIKLMIGSSKKRHLMRYLEKEKIINNFDSSHVTLHFYPSFSHTFMFNFEFLCFFGGTTGSENISLFTTLHPTGHALVWSKNMFLKMLPSVWKRSQMATRNVHLPAGTGHKQFCQVQHQSYCW